MNYQDYDNEPEQYDYQNSYGQQSYDDLPQYKNIFAREEDPNPYGNFDYEQLVSPRVAVSCDTSQKSLNAQIVAKDEQIKTMQNLIDFYDVAKVREQMLNNVKYGRKGGRLSSIGLETFEVPGIQQVL